MPSKQQLSDLYGLPHELAANGGFKAHRTKEKEGMVHNLLHSALKYPGVDLVTTCGMEVGFEWIPYRGTEPTSCHRCSLLDAYRVLGQ